MALKEIHFRAKLLLLHGYKGLSVVPNQPSSGALAVYLIAFNATFTLDSALCFFLLIFILYNYSINKLDKQKRLTSRTGGKPECYPGFCTGKGAIWAVFLLPGHICPLSTLILVCSVSLRQAAWASLACRSSSALRRASSSSLPILWRLYAVTARPT
jgi:hypothetical protein